MIASLSTRCFLRSRTWIIIPHRFYNLVACSPRLRSRSANVSATSCGKRWISSGTSQVKGIQGNCSSAPLSSPSPVIITSPCPLARGHSRSDLVNLEPRGFRAHDRISARTFSLRANRRFEFTHCDLRSAARIASPRRDKSHVMRRKFRRRFPPRANLFPGMEENCAMDQPQSTSLFSIFPESVLRIERFAEIRIDAVGREIRRWFLRRWSS